MNFRQVSLGAPGIFISDLILFIKQANLHNYADDNTITYFSKSL